MFLFQVKCNFIAFSELMWVMIYWESYQVERRLICAQWKQKQPRK